jgi:hypothetical protein
MREQPDIGRKSSAERGPYATFLDTFGDDRRPHPGGGSGATPGQGRFTAAGWRASAGRSAAATVIRRRPLIVACAAAIVCLPAAVSLPAVSRAFSALRAAGLGSAEAWRDLGPRLDDYLARRLGLREIAVSALGASGLLPCGHVEGAKAPPNAMALLAEADRRHCPGYWDSDAAGAETPTSVSSAP